ncbi:MAG: sugar ABC transporter ATP-binding protein [bacterium]
MSRVILEFDQIEKRFHGVPVLHGASFPLVEGHILGLVGENGAGKSTLMNILGGVFPPDGGRLVLDNGPFHPRGPADAYRRGIAFIHQELNLFANLSIAENLFIHDFPTRRILGMPWVDRQSMARKTRDRLESVGLQYPPDTLIENLSQGERQLVEIAKALNLDARILILDEPTTSLTARETGHLFERIEQWRARGISMIYISHALGDVLKLCDDIVILRDGAVAAQGPRAKFDLETMIARMVGRSMDQLYPPRDVMPFPEPLLAVNHLSRPGIVHDISFTLRRREILGISGLMGSGRSELARILFGLDPGKEGSIQVGERVLSRGTPRKSIGRGLAFLTENRREEGLLMEASTLDNIALAALPGFTAAPWYPLSSGTLKPRVQESAAGVRLTDASLERAVKTLSGGNQQKAVLAKWLLIRPSVMILDEPTRGIDVGAKYEVYKIMNELTRRGVGILFISSEIEELMGMCDRILVMSRGEIKECLERPEFDRERILRAALGENRQT